VIPSSAFLVLAAVLFALGAAAFFVKKDLLTQFMSVEVSLAKSAVKAEAQVIVFFVLTVAAAEAVVGMAIVLLVFRRRKTIRSEEISELKG